MLCRQRRAEQDAAASVVWGRAHAHIFPPLGLVSRRCVHMYERQVTTLLLQLLWNCAGPCPHIVPSMSVCMVQGRCWLCRLVCTPGAAAVLRDTPHMSMLGAIGMRRYARILPAAVHCILQPLMFVVATVSAVRLCRCATCLCWPRQWWQLPSAQASLRCGRHSRPAKPQLLLQLEPAAQMQLQGRQPTSTGVLSQTTLAAKDLCSFHTAWCLLSPQQRASSYTTPRCAYVRSAVLIGALAAGFAVVGGYVILLVRFSPLTLPQMARSMQNGHCLTPSA
jgi:hypothetical protein